MIQALRVLGGLALGLGFILAVLTAWFAFGFFIRIIGFVVALVAIIIFAAFCIWSWWHECVVEPRQERKKRGR